MNNSEKQGKKTMTTKSKENTVLLNDLQVHIELLADFLNKSHLLCFQKKEKVSAAIWTILKMKLMNNKK